MRNKSQPVKMGVLTLEDETAGHLPAASATVDPDLGDHLPIPNLVVPTRSPLTVEISLTPDNNHRSLEHTSISSNTSPELEDTESGDGDDSILRCSHCECSYPQIGALRSHMEEAHPDKPNKNICDKCGAAFVLRTQLEKHLTFHSPTSQVCKVCQKTFANVYRLQRHMISHNESSDLRKFKCPTCAKAFKFKHHLKEHIRIHSGEKPFECGNCGKRFSHSGSYSSHMTSKKCWVVNVKNRRPGDIITKNPLSPDKAEDAIRPMNAKVGENGTAADMTSLKQFYVTQLAQQVMQAGAMTFDPTGGHLGQQYMAAVAAAAHLNGNRPPFMPYPGSGAAGHMIPPHHMIPGLPTSAYPMPVMLSPSKSHNCVATSNSEKQSGKDSTSKSASPLVSPQVPQRSSASKSPKTDENQNSQSVPDSHENSPKSNETPSADQSSSEENKENNASDEPSKNLDAVKKILDKINEHVEMQKHTGEDKTQISKLGTQEGKSSGVDESPEKDDSEINEEGKAQDVPLPCRHCKDVFHSPVELHQHERYLCKLNREIQIRDNVTLDPNKLLSLSPGGTNNSKKVGSSTASVTSEGDSEGDCNRDDMFVDKDGHQYRVRSMLSDDQQKILKSHYVKNPRPDKFELMQIATEVGFPKRVVQVWFQNMRARDRRRGLPVPTQRGVPMIQGTEKPIAPAPVKQEASSPAPKPIGASTPAYIPVVPHIPFSGVTTSSPTNQNLVYYANKANGQIVSPAVSPAAVTGNVAFTMQMEPLDLTTKSNPIKAHVHKPFSGDEAEKKKNNVEALNLSQKSTGEKIVGLENSGIYKYMLQEGMLPGHLTADGSAPRLMTPGSRDSSSAERTTPESGAVFPMPITSTPNRGISPSLPPISPASHSDLTSPPSSLDSSFNSTMSLDSAGMETGSLNGLFKSRRARKKSWRQLESEEGQMELADALEDGEEPCAKKRKSWKAHKLDDAEGLYACDQCDKMFSKQSSLARHKYEHSGQRPYHCEICSKSFKHKHHLTEHKRLHSGEKPFECKKCGKRFSHSGSYSQHMNHRYKYCKPMRLGMSGEMTEMSDMNGSLDIANGGMSPGSEESN